MPVKCYILIAVLQGRDLLVFGGTGIPFGDCSSNQLHICNLDSMLWRSYSLAKGQLPEKAYGHVGILYIIIYSGYNLQDSNSLCIFTFIKFLTRYSLKDSISSCLIKMDLSFHELVCLHVCHLLCWTPNISDTAFHSTWCCMCFLIAFQTMTVLGTKLYIVGGTSGYVYNSDVHRLDICTGNWKKLKPSMEPSGRYNLSTRLMKMNLSS